MLHSFVDLFLPLHILLYVLAFHEVHLKVLEVEEMGYVAREPKSVYDVLGSKVYRRLHVVIHNGEFSFFEQKQIDDEQVLRLEGLVQGSVAEGVLHVDIGTLVQQHFGHLVVGVAHCVVQGRVVVLIPHVQVCRCQYVFVLHDL